MPKTETDIEKRNKYGMLCGIVGIFLNLILFAGKLFAGMFSGAISITADAFNNLSDAGSSIITIAGFNMAGHRVFMAYCSDTTGINSRKMRHGGIQFLFFKKA